MSGRWSYEDTELRTYQSTEDLAFSLKDTHAYGILQSK